MQPPFTADNRKKTIEKIMRGKLILPGYLTSDARDLLRRLLKRQAHQRLGAMPDDAGPIKRHNFFKNVNWEDVIHKRYEPPYKPRLVSNELKNYF